MKISLNNILKKTLAVVLAVGFAFAMVSCGESERSVFWYEEDLYGVRCTVDTNKGDYGEVVMKVTYGELDHALVESPAELAGTDFVRGDDISFVDFAGQTIDMTDNGLGDINVIFNAFTAKEEDISSMSKNDDGKTQIGIYAQGGVYTIILGGDGLPEEIHFDGTSTVRITDIEFLTKETDTGSVGKIEFVGSADESESAEGTSEKAETDTEEAE